ncbi:partitioning defective 3 homolog isoform X2 [Stegodyphus dumicola]|uniref:partitioning defective 3 homolog isoform X2 n=1 Tax=Stegodyphus dumicola TaxID=202533 RepID=UPI0015AFF1DB|nr:partitioning defective 3 homolog isoform X2 [Stegodyphus dumicola]
MHNGGDGTSASSVGTESPDIFQNGEIISAPLIKSYNNSDVEISDEKAAAGILPLHVRRGSEPALNRLSPSLLSNGDSCKRWSAAVLASDDTFKQLNSEGEEQSEDDLPPGEREDGSGEEKSISYQQYLNSWNCDGHLNRDERREPLGGPTSPKHSTDETEDSDCSSSSHKKVIEVMKLKKEDGPLGIRIVPADDSPENNKGVIIQGIEPGGRIDRDGRFCVGDRITEINGLKLSKDSYRNAQEILRDAMKAPELNIHCIKKDSTKITINSKPNLKQKKNARNDKLADNEKVSSSLISKLQVTSPGKKIPSTPLHKSSPAHSSIRKVGRRILVHLTKGSEGLGFSITSKDPNNGPPFFIKNILPAGAAVDDGRLKTGDKLLEVNKVDVSNMTQTEVLSMLRKVPFGDVVELVISRQETDLSPSPSLPRELPHEKCEEDVGIFPWKRRDIYTYEIPLNDTGSAGLGVSVKGKTSNTENGQVDMGIFLKNIFHGGAAYKDGRLRNNDQLLNVNGISLLGMTNGQAMETLRRAMIQGEGPNAVSNAIILTVARRVPSPTQDNALSDQGDSSCHDRSDSLLSESGDSFYVSNENLSPSSNKCNGVTPDTSTSDNSGNTVIFRLPSDERLEDVSEDKENDLDVSSSSPAFKHNHLLHNLSDNNISDTNIVNTVEYQQSNQRLNEITHEDQENLIDLHPDQSSSFLKYEASNGFKETGHTVNHKKSLSNPSETDFSYRSPHRKPKTVPQTNYCDSPAFFKDATNERLPMDSHFNRSGFGRQSMPEKKILQAHQRSKYLPNRIMHENRIDDCTSTHNLQQSHCQQYHHREMPVDVGPYETYVKFQPKTPNGAKGSCNSPDCPYHAVPTTGRESGSSEGTCTQVGPSLGLYKSSSLESLQTMIQEQQKRNMPLGTSACSSRGCNESFRAAVDKSFEAIDQIEHAASDEGRHLTNTNRNHTRAKTINSVVPEAGKKNEKSTKKKGLFRGLGSVFRFGKSSKKSVKGSAVSTDKEQKLETTPQQSKKATQDEQERIQRQYQELVERQRLIQTTQYNHSVNRQLSSKPSFTFPRSGTSSPHPSQSSTAISPQSRQERMQILRLEHQRKHKQRNGFYPQEDQEELYEQRMKQNTDCSAMINRPLPPLPHQDSESISQGSNLELTPKTQSLEIYKEMSKPGSRKGFADPNRYSHYMNFQEIQQHLQQFHLHQNMYLKDWPPEMQPSYLMTEQKYMANLNRRHYRHTVSSPRSRPNSEFFDFRNSDMSKSPLRGISESGSLPKRMFQNGKQRLPIPAVFMLQQQNCISNTPNEHVSSNFYNHNPTLDDLHEKRKTGSKV